MVAARAARDVGPAEALAVLWPRGPAALLALLSGVLSAVLNALRRYRCARLVYRLVDARPHIPLSLSAAVVVQGVQAQCSVVAAEIIANSHYAAAAAADQEPADEAEVSTPSSGECAAGRRSSVQSRTRHGGASTGTSTLYQRRMACVHGCTVAHCGALWQCRSSCARLYTDYWLWLARLY